MAKEETTQTVAPSSTAPSSGAVATPPSATVADPAGSAPAPAVEMPAFDAPKLPDAGHAIDMLGDVELDVKIELGRCQMLVEDVLRLSPGSVVELDKLAGDPVDVFVNEHLVARGEVLVVNDNFCVRINEIIATPG